jgi:hypothetical protein
MPAALARDSGNAATAAQPAMPRADAHPRPRRRATARSHGVSPESVISRGRIAPSMLPRFAAVNCQQGSSLGSRAPLASGIARICRWICAQFLPAGATGRFPQAQRSRRFVTVRAIRLMAGSKHCEGSSFAANAPGCAHGLSDGVLRMGLPPAAGPWEWPPNIAARLCSKQHRIPRARRAREPPALEP